MILTKEEVELLVAPIFEQYKQINRNRKHKNYKEWLKYSPDYHSTYKLSCEYAERIKVHSEVCDFPEQLFLEHSPNQTKEEYDYMKANFKQNTLPVFVDYDATNKRCFNDGNWNIYYPTEDPAFLESGDTYQEYVEKEIRNFGSLESFVKSYLATQKSVDANAVVAVKPQSIPTVEDEIGELVVDDSQLLEPQPYLFHSKQVLSDPKYDSKYFILESNEKSEVQYGTKKEYIGYVLEVYDEVSIWRVRQVGKYIDFKFEVELYFVHNEGVIPACRLLGIPQMIGDSILWQSPFIYACDLLDLALMNKNYLQCSVATVMFPYRVVLGAKCEYQYSQDDDSGTVHKCNGGYIYSPEGLIKCPKCKGIGLVNRISQVGGELLLSPSDVTGEGDAKFSGNALTFVSPETNASDFVNKLIEQDIQKAYQVIHVKQSNQQSTGTGVGGDGTATASILDLKTMYASIKTFSDQIFSRYEFIANRIGWQRYGESFQPPVISYPVSFDFNTEQDYIKQISDAQNANLAAPVIENLIKKYLYSLYYNETVTQRIFDLILASDRFFVMTSDAVQAKERIGLAEKWEVILHDSATQFLDELMDEYRSTEICSDDDCTKGFFALDFADQKELLIKKAKDKADAIAKSNIKGVIGGVTSEDDLGKIPLALQQIALARERANTAGDTDLFNKLGIKMDELLNNI